MMGGGGTKSLSSLQNLVNFLADPKKAQEVLDGHAQAIEGHKQAAEEHAQAKADAESALEALTAKQDELDIFETSLNDWSARLDRDTTAFRLKEKDFEAREQALAHDKEEAVKFLKHHVDEAKDIVDKAKAEADKIIKDQQVVAKRILGEAENKEIWAKKAKDGWQKRYDELDSMQEDLNRREEALIKRELAVAKLADVLKGA